MILHEIAEYTKLRVEEDKKKISLDSIKSIATTMQKGDFSFERAISATKNAVIAEVKKASPSKGIISHDFDYKQIAKSYVDGGATCLSVLTEPKWFMGSDSIFEEIRKDVRIPIIRKDFTIDEYQIYQAKIMGADCVLLICALLSQNQLEEYLAICESLGISALVETHDENEIAMARKAGARMIGVNNRNLHDFSVDISTASNLKRIIPENILFVAESGITTLEDAQNLLKNGANALLIGEALMRSANRNAFLTAIREF